MAIKYYRRKIYTLSFCDADTIRLFEKFKKTLKLDISIIPLFPIYAPYFKNLHPSKNNIYQTKPINLLIEQ